MPEPRKRADFHNDPADRLPDEGCPVLVVSFYLLKCDLPRAARKIIGNDPADVTDRPIVQHGG